MNIKWKFKWSVPNIVLYISFDLTSSFFYYPGMIVTSSISRSRDDDDDDDGAPCRDDVTQSPSRRSGSSVVAGSVPEVVSDERHLSTNTHFRSRFSGTMTMMVTQQNIGGGESPEVANRKRCRSFAGDLEEDKPVDHRNAGQTGGPTCCLGCKGHVTNVFGRADVEGAADAWDTLPFLLLEKVSQAPDIGGASALKKHTKFLTMDECGAGPHERDTPV